MNACHPLCGEHLVDPALPQAIGVDECLIRRHDEDEEVVLGIARPHAVHSAGHAHMPQLAAYLLDHLDAVSCVVLPALEFEGVAFEVPALHILVELETARAEDDALASLDRLLLGADHRGAADDLLSVGVLDKMLVMAVEQHLDAQILALLVEDLERGHAESRRVGDGLAARTARQEGVLGNGACDGLLVDVVFKFVLVGVFAVSQAFFDPGVDDGRGRVHVLRHLVPVLAHALSVLDDGELAVVDGAVATAAHRSLLQHEHLLSALVGADERRPHARASVADDQEVALVVPALRQPLLRRVCVRRAAGQRGGTCHSGGSDARSLQKRAARQPSLFFRAHCLSFSLHCFGFALNGRRLRLPYAGCVRLPSSSTPYFFLVGRSAGGKHRGGAIRALHPICDEEEIAILGTGDGAAPRKGSGIR